MGENNTRALFQIRAINKDTDKVVVSEEVVAEGEKEALYESDLKEKLDAIGLKKSDVHVIVKAFGSLPPKEEVKSVKIIAGVDGYKLIKEK
jgi:hypothetical protein